VWQLAHDLGYPHPDLMLRAMSARQYSEFLAYIAARANSREQGEADAQEANIMQHLAKVQAAQSKK